eukprot:Unigene11425_Nuclearia_a/m.34848 Unigene11425_Nuclearia_a/g.34848  ORF Unigene11425_Nuclearia_a/g.34848 Unigene11425_Nuclearia_a/m.34848 type:complete len:350 (-) Unigene11425_Nuclearia_a:245-1294(-)
MSRAIISAAERRLAQKCTWISRAHADRRRLSSAHTLSRAISSSNCRVITPCFWLKASKPGSSSGTLGLSTCAITAAASASQHCGSTAAPYGLGKTSPARNSNTCSRFLYTVPMTCCVITRAAGDAAAGSLAAACVRSFGRCTTSDVLTFGTEAKSIFTSGTCTIGSTTSSITRPSSAEAAMLSVPNVSMAPSTSVSDAGLSKCSLASVPVSRGVTVITLSAPDARTDTALAKSSVRRARSVAFLRSYSPLISWSTSASRLFSLLRGSSRRIPPISLSVAAARWYSPSSSVLSNCCSRSCMRVSWRSAATTPSVADSCCLSWAYSRAGLVRRARRPPWGSSSRCVSVSTA